MTAQDNQLLSSVRTAESCQTLRNFPNTSGTFQIWSELNHAAMQLLPKCSMEPFERGATFQNLKMQNLCKTNYFRNFAIPPERPAAFSLQLSWATFLSNIFDCTGWLRWYLLFLCWGLVAQQVLFLLQGLTPQVHGTIVFKKCVGGILPSRANSSSGKSSSKSVFGRV